jgi:hypothetical protein
MPGRPKRPRDTNQLAKLIRERTPEEQGCRRQPWGAEAD